MLARYILATVVAVGLVQCDDSDAWARVCEPPDPTRAVVADGKACGSRTGPCAAGLVCRAGSGSCRCLAPDPTDPSTAPPHGTPTTAPVATTTWPPTTTAPGVTTTTSTRPPTTRPAPTTSTTGVGASSSTTTTTRVVVTTTTMVVVPPSLFRAPSPRDISIRLKRDQRAKWTCAIRRPDEQPGCTPRTATQPERASMYLLGVARMLPEGLLYAKRMGAACATAYRSNTKNYETENTRLRVFYVDSRRNKTWAILGDNGPPDYQHVQHLGEDLQDCSLATPAAKRACAVLATPDLLDWMDLRVAPGADGVLECRFGVDLVLSLPDKRTEDDAMARVGALDYRVPLPAPTAAQRAAMAHLLATHHATDRAFCTGTPGPAPGSVQRAAAALLATASTEAQRHAFLMIFTAARDETPTGWSRQQHCDWTMLKGFAMHAWGDCLDQPGTAQWICLTRTRVSHETLHLLAALRDDTLRARIGDHTDTQLTSEPARTGLEWLACLTGETPGCRLPWVPDPATWRVRVP